MSTTALFVEILVIGAGAELWLAVLMLPLLPGFSVGRLLAFFSQAKDAQPAAALISFALTFLLVGS